mgnify:CR=1 FL=1
MDQIDLELQLKLTEQRLGLDGKSQEEVKEVPPTAEGDSILEGIARILGLGPKDADDEALTEGLKTKSIIRRGKKEKFRALVGSSAAIIAKEVDDPLFKKLAKVNKLRLQLKAKIQKKYAQKAIRRAKDILRGRTVAAAKDLPSTMAKASKAP